MKNFLEIGCGTGFVLSGVASAFPQTCLSASEIDSAGLQFVRQKSKIRRLVSDGCPFHSLS